MATTTTTATAVSPINYERWLDFATRMARHGWEHMTDARRERLEQEVREFIEGYDPAYPYQPKPMTGWDGNAWDCPEPSWAIWCICDDFYDHCSDNHFYLEEYQRRPRKTYFMDQLASCIRAGLNAAGDENAGVVGFTVGDLRRMYPEGIPDWYLEGFAESENAHQTILSAADDEAVWL